MARINKTFSLSPESVDKLTYLCKLSKSAYSRFLDLAISHMYDNAMKEEVKEVKNGN